MAAPDIPRSTVDSRLLFETSRKLAVVSSSVSPSAKASAATRGPKLRKWVVVVGAILSSLLIFVAVRLQGHVTGRELSPTHFHVRTFSFYEIPLLHIQITPIKRAGVTPKTATYIRQKSLIPNPKGDPKTWHLVTLSRGVSGTTPADAKLLHDQLTLKVDGGDFWRQWSIDHPQRAKKLWPVIQRLAERELYILMPGLMELALIDQTPAKFSEQADLWLREEYIKLVNDMREANREELAGQLLEEALTDFPDDVELAKLRSSESR